MKSLHAGGLVDFQNHMTSTARKEVIDSGWILSRTNDAIALGVEFLPSVDPFHDIAPPPREAVYSLTCSI